MPHYYVETDGEVYLIMENGSWRFPMNKESLPFPVVESHTLQVLGEDVCFCKPLLPYHPTNWVHKDELIAWDNAVPLVRQAVNTTLPRVVTEGVIVEAGKILLVKANRGYNKNRWTLPGGFVGYGESPAQAVVREIQEEVGVPAQAGPLLGIESFIGQESSLHWHMCFYEATLLSHDFAPPKDEIEAVCWFSLDDALKAINFKNIQRMLRAYFQK